MPPPLSHQPPLPVPLSVINVIIKLKVLSASFWILDLLDSLIASEPCSSYRWEEVPGIYL